MVATRNASRRFNRLTNGSPTLKSVNNTTVMVTMPSKRVAVAAVVAAWTISCRRCLVVVAASSANLKARRRESPFSTL